MSNIRSIQRINREIENFDNIDELLVESTLITREFGIPGDYVEAHLYTNLDEYLFSNENFTNYRIIDSKPDDSSNIVSNKIEIDFDSLFRQNGIDYGRFILAVKCLRKRIAITNDKPFFIKQISGDRTEIRISSNSLDGETIRFGAVSILDDIAQLPYLFSFLLNFGKNKLVNAVNIAIDETDEKVELLIKLLEPLPVEFDINSRFSICEELSETSSYEIELFPDPVVEPVEKLKGPDFSINVEKSSILTSEYFNIKALISNDDRGALNKIKNTIKEKNIRINIDYSDYSNFVKFSSAAERLKNFKYKVEQIESFRQKINLIQGSTGSNVSQSVFTFEKNIDEIVQNFDPYENFLFYDSSSSSWPKVNSNNWYKLADTTSSIFIDWYGQDRAELGLFSGQIATASFYDGNNQDNLQRLVPDFISFDPNNDGYFLFVSMLGHHFDNLWVYQKAIKDIWYNHNDLEIGISKDLVFEMVQSLGMKLYDDSQRGNYSDVSLQNTGSFNISVDTNIPAESRSKEYFKRIYNNIAFLLRTKGSTRGLHALLTTYGIPETLLTVEEYGGDRKNDSTPDYSYERFSYSLYNSGSFIRLPWLPLTTNKLNYGLTGSVPDTIEFRIKPDLNNVKSSVVLLNKSYADNIDFYLKADYINNAGVDSANFSLIFNSMTPQSCSVVVPFYHGESDWWNVMIRRRNKYLSVDITSSQQYDLFIKRKIDDRVSFQYSASLSGSVQINPRWSYFISSSTDVSVLDFFGTDRTGSILPSDNSFIGDCQEIRYWSIPVSEEAFDQHVLNPESIVANDDSGSFKSLSARFPLGNNLHKYNHQIVRELVSLHPNFSVPISEGSGSYFLNAVYGLSQYGNSVYGGTGSVELFDSFNTASFISFDQNNVYNPNVERCYSKTVNSGFHNPVTSKVRIVSSSLEGEVLRPDVSIVEKDRYQTADIHFLDISLSPQTEINRDIISQFGDTLDIDQIIGDPRQRNKRNYEELTSKKEEYFSKYKKDYDLKDFFKLISYYENTVFNMIEDAVPFRSDLSIGLTIKSPILERSKIQLFDPSVEELSIIPEINRLTDVEIEKPFLNEGDQMDAFDGIISGSNIDVTKTFEEDNFNPFLQSENIDYEEFVRSEFDVLNPVIDGLKISSKTKKVDNLNRNIEANSTMNDDLYSFKSFTNPRYNGSKVSSRFINIPTSEDDTYGANPVLYSNSNTFAFVNEFNKSNLNFFDKTTVNIKYLIDASGSLTELSKKNENLHTVQNLFKQGDFTGVTLMDPLNPTNQSTLEGNKKIWYGGFSFSPIIFRETGENMIFDYSEISTFVETRLGVKGVATNSVRWIAFNQKYPNIGHNGGDVQFFINSTPQANGTRFSLSDGFTVPNNTWPYQNEISIAVFNTLYTDNSGTQFIPAGLNQLEGPAYWLSLDYFLPLTTGSSGGYATTGFTGALTQTITSDSRYVSFKAPKNSEYNINLNIPIRLKAGNNSRVGQSVFKLVAVVEKLINGSWNYLTHSKLRKKNVPTGVYAINEDNSSIWNDFQSNEFLEVDCVISDFRTVLSQNDQIRVRLFIVEQRRFFSKIDGIDFQIVSGNGSVGYFEVFDMVSSQTLPITSYELTDDPALFVVDPQDSRTIEFNDTASILYNFSRFNTINADIRNLYSEVTDLFKIEPNDIFRFGSYYQPTRDLYRVHSVQEPVILNPGPPGSSNVNVVSRLRVSFDRFLPTSQVSSQKFAIFRKKPDETVVLLDYNKTPGEASSGFIIPSDLKEDVKTEIANIISPIKDKLLSNVLIT